MPRAKQSKELWMGHSFQSVSMCKTVKRKKKDDRKKKDPERLRRWCIWSRNVDTLSFSYYQKYRYKRCFPKTLTLKSIQIPCLLLMVNIKEKLLQKFLPQTSKLQCKLPTTDRQKQKVWKSALKKRTLARPKPNTKADWPLATALLLQQIPPAYTWNTFLYKSSVFF